ncbi:chaperonin 10-like protein [Crassisporium funariophilum]|nr:chaperonin 10-like protein [Crassisporium funariophilum]
MSPVALPSTTAAVLHGPRDMRITERTLWPPSQGQVQVQVVSTGLCGSDLHYYMQGRNGDFAVRAPLVLGHEAAGIITAIGPGVSNFSIGQRVAIEAGINCRACGFCDKGRYNLCKGMRFCSSASIYPHVDGTLQTRMNHPAHVLHPLPDSCTFEQAALAEPLSVLIHASRRCKLAPSQSVFVFGVGAIGLLACALAKHTGASRVVAADINPQRLEWAKKNGFADEVYCLPTPSPAHSSHSTSPSAPTAPSIPKTNGMANGTTASKPAPTPAPSQPTMHSEDSLRKAKEGAMTCLAAFDAKDGFDVVFECTGAETAIQMSVFVATTGGRVMLIGMGTRSALMPLSTAALREIDIMGSFRYANTYPEALHLLASGSLPTVSRLVTHRFGLSETKKAFETLARGVDDKGALVLKVMVGADSS